jgi:YEATS domain-containing protein 4
MSFYQGKKAEETKQHKWACYIRPLSDDEDLSLWIKKVIFVLHPSFPEPVRTIDRPPFEIHELGWGEFEVGI